MTPRQKMDRYETPEHYLSALPKLDIRGCIFEPCVGSGTIASWIRDTITLDLITNDLDEDVDASYHDDATRLHTWKQIAEKHAKGGKFDWVIMNPPFSDIEKFIIHALTCSRNVISLTRLSFLEPTKFRRRFFTRRMPRMVIVLPRYQFTSPSKDVMTCCWLGWGPEVPKLWTIETTEPPK